MVLLVTSMRSRDFPTTSGVADTMGCKYRTAYERLDRLGDDGRLGSRKVGSSLVWAITGGGA